MKLLVREKLYAQIWQEPIGVLSRRLGISSAKLREACRTMVIPVPTLTHWRAVKAGHETVRPQLPPNDGPNQFCIHSKEKESLVDWIARTAPAEAPQPKLSVLPNSTTQSHLVPLRVWATDMFGDYAPHANTLLRWAHEGRIQPQPKKIARKWWVKPSAEYLAD